eukprot:750930-Hanusia_phi.AAC.4
MEMACFECTNKDAVASQLFQVRMRRLVMFHMTEGSIVLFHEERRPVSCPVEVEERIVRLVALI